MNKTRLKTEKATRPQWSDGFNMVCATSELPVLYRKMYLYVLKIFLVCPMSIMRLPSAGRINEDERYLADITSKIFTYFTKYPI